MARILTVAPGAGLLKRLQASPLLEGHEIEVLRGFAKFLAENRVDLSKTTFADFPGVLPAIAKAFWAAMRTASSSVGSVRSCTACVSVPWPTPAILIIGRPDLRATSSDASTTAAPAVSSARSPLDIDLK